MTAVGHERKSSMDHGMSGAGGIADVPWTRPEGPVLAKTRPAIA